MNTKTNQKEIITKIFELKIRAAKFEKWGRYLFPFVTAFVVIGNIPLLDLLIYEHYIRDMIPFLLKGFLFNTILVIDILLFAYAAFLQQKQNLLFKELELLIKYQIEFP